MVVEVVVEAISGDGVGSVDGAFDPLEVAALDSWELYVSSVSSGSFCFCIFFA